MIVECIGNRRVLGSTLAGLAIVLSSSVVLGQPPQPPQQPAQQAPVQQPGQQRPGEQQAQQSQAQQQQQQPQAQQQQSQAQPQQQQPQAQPQQQAQQRQQQAQQGAGQEDVEIAAAAPGAQPGQPMWNSVRVIQVKHDQVAEFEGLIKELRTAMQGGGETGFSVWSTELGDINTYHITSPFASFASIQSMQETPPMEPMEWANWLNRIGDTIDSHTFAVARMRPDLSIVPDTQAAQEMPELMMLITDTVMAGKTRDYETFVRDELMPALRQVDIDAVFANEIAIGAEGRTWVFAVPIPGWEVLDQPSPIVEALGPQAAEELMLRGDALVESTETSVLRYRADLSSQPPAP